MSRGDSFQRATCLHEVAGQRKGEGSSGLRVDVLGLATECTIESGGGACGLTIAVRLLAQVDRGFYVTRLDRQRPFERLNRFGATGKAYQRNAAIVVRLCIFGLQRYGAVERGERLDVAPGANQRKAQVVVREALPGSKFRDALEASDPDRDITPGERQRAGVGQCGDVRWIRREKLCVRGLCFVKTPRLLQTKGSSERGASAQGVKLLSPSAIRGDAHAQRIQLDEAAGVLLIVGAGVVLETGDRRVEQRVGC